MIFAVVNHYPHKNWANAFQSEIKFTSDQRPALLVLFIALFLHQ